MENQRLIESLQKDNYVYTGKQTRHQADSLRKKEVCLQ